jgi:hypothetical protein
MAMTHSATKHGSRVLALAVLGSAAVLAGCGGGSGGQSSAPRVGALSDQVVNQDTTLGPLPIAITAGAGHSADLTVTAMAADGTLVPPDNLVVSGTGADRTLTLTPAPDQTGTTQVTLTVQDGMGHVVSQAFRLTVNPVYAAFTQYATETFQADDTSTPKQVSGLTFQPDADNNADAFSALVE